jgi:hypothetical protein
MPAKHSAAFSKYHSISELKKISFTVIAKNQSQFSMLRSTILAMAPNGKLTEPIITSSFKSCAVLIFVLKLELCTLQLTYICSPLWSALSEVVISRKIQLVSKFRLGILDSFSAKDSFDERLLSQGQKTFLAASWKQIEYDVEHGNNSLFSYLCFLSSYSKSTC